MATTTMTDRSNATLAELTRQKIYWAIAIAVVFLITITLTMRTRNDSVITSTAPATSRTITTETNSIVNGLPATFENRVDSTAPQGSNLVVPPKTGTTSPAPK